MVRYGHHYGIDELAAIVADFHDDPDRLPPNDRTVLQVLCRRAIEQIDCERHRANGETPLLRRAAEDQWRVVAEFARWGR